MQLLSLRGQCQEYDDIVIHTTCRFTHTHIYIYIHTHTDFYILYTCVSCVLYSYEDDLGRLVFDQFLPLLQELFCKRLLFCIELTGGFCESRFLFAWFPKSMFRWAISLISRDHITWGVHPTVRKWSLFIAILVLLDPSSGLYLSGLGFPLWSFIQPEDPKRHETARGQKWCARKRAINPGPFRSVLATQAAPKVDDLITEAHQLILSN